jgi:hypothetical protein
LDIEILNTNIMAKAQSIININLQCHHLHFSACQYDHLVVLIIPFQLRPEVELVCYLIEYLHKKLIRDLLKTTSFLLSQIAQQKANVIASSCLFKSPLPILFRPNVKHMLFIKRGRDVKSNLN